jgi:hypothetical protein
MNTCFGAGRPTSKKSLLFLMALALLLAMPTPALARAMPVPSESRCRFPRKAQFGTSCQRSFQSSQRQLSQRLRAVSEPPTRGAYKLPYRGVSERLQR